MTNTWVGYNSGDTFSLVCPISPSPHPQTGIQPESCIEITDNEKISKPTVDGPQCAPQCWTIVPQKCIPDLPILLFPPQSGVFVIIAKLCLPLRGAVNKVRDFKFCLPSPCNVSKISSSCVSQHMWLYSTRESLVCYQLRFTHSSHLPQCYCSQGSTPRSPTLGGLCLWWVQVCYITWVQMFWQLSNDNHPGLVIS